MFYSPTILQHSPSRPVDWRWRRANWLVQENKRRLSRNDDAATIVAARYLANAARCLEAAAGEFPNLDAAFRLYARGGALEVELQARILARQTREVITQRTGVSTACIAIYVVTFFDVDGHIAAGD